MGRLAWDKMGGLLPALVQDRRSGRLLMLAYMNREALERSLATGLATFFSRSRNALWEKGETSGNRLANCTIFPDCDGDALLVIADPQGPTCHLGTASCFGADLNGPGWLAELSAIIAERARSGGAQSYTRQLLEAGPERISKKIGEEGVEVALAGVGRDTAGCVEEAADLLFHLGVLMEARDFSWEDIVSVLKKRHAQGASNATASS